MDRGPPVDVSDERPAAGGGDGDGEVSLLHLVNVVLRHRGLVWKWPVALAALLLALALLSPAEFTTSVTFLPQMEQRQMPGGLSGLASQFGLDVPSSLGGGRGPQFYAELLQSHDLFEAAVETPFPAASADSGVSDATLVDYYGVSGETAARRRVEAVEELREHLSVSTNPQTSTVQFGVTTGRPELSEQVASRLVELVNEFNLETRQSQAEAERRFLEDRVEEARESLAATEDSLETFLEQNRQYQNSPRLRFRYERLQRRVDLRQQVYTSLAQSYEQARIEEVRDTPVITVMEPPEVPAKPDPRRLALRAVLGLALGLVFGVVAAFVREFFTVAGGRDTEHVGEFRRLTGEIRERWRERFARLFRRFR